MASAPKSAVAERLPEIALGVLCLFAAVLMFHLTRGTTLWFDDWQWALERRGYGVDAFLDPHNGHLSIVPVVVYKFLFATVGVTDWAYFRIAILVAHLTVVVLVFTYARPRIGGPGAAMAASLLLFLGPGWQNILWPFQIGYLLSLIGGIGALILLERRQRGADVGASLLLALSLGSSGLSIPIALGLTVDILWRRHWRDLWIVAAPGLLYGVWWLAYYDTRAVGTIGDVPQFVVESAAASLSSLLGLSGDVVGNDPRANLVRTGLPLLVLALVAAVWRVRRLGKFPPRVGVFLAIVLSFWSVTEFTRGPFSSPFASRYIYVGALLVLLIAVELAAGARISRRVGVVLAVVTVVVMVPNVQVLREGGQLLRSDAAQTRASLGAAELVSEKLPYQYEFRGTSGYPLVIVRKEPYFAMRAAAGTPADSLAEIEASTALARQTADRELITALVLRPKPASAPVARGRCLDVPGGAARVRLPPTGLRIAVRNGSATVGLRRFGMTFIRIGRVASGSPAVIRVPKDRASLPWHLEVVSRGSVRVCGLG